MITCHTVRFDDPQCTFGRYGVMAKLKSRALTEGRRPSMRVILAVVCLLAIFEAELLISVHRESQTADESVHLYAGYTYWKRADFGINPEHPPLLKLVAALPLLPLGVPPAPTAKGPFRPVGVSGGLEFLYSNDADALLFRARAAATLFALALAVLVLAAARNVRLRCRPMRAYADGVSSATAR